jgi:excisionase family DNA binding protein
MPTTTDSDDVGVVDQWFGSREAAAYLRCSARTLRRAYVEGRLEVARSDGSRRVRFRREWLDAYAQGQPPTPTTRRSA